MASDGWRPPDRPAPGNDGRGACVPRARDAAQFQAVLDVAQRVPPRQQGIARRNEADAGPGFGRTHAEHRDLPRGRRHQACQHVEDRGLAATGTTERAMNWPRGMSRCRSRSTSCAVPSGDVKVTQSPFSDTAGPCERSAGPCERPAASATAATDGSFILSFHRSRSGGRQRSNHRSAAAAIMFRILAIIARTIRIPYTASNRNSPEYIEISCPRPSCEAMISDPTTPSNA